MRVRVRVGACVRACVRERCAQTRTHERGRVPARSSGGVHMHGLQHNLRSSCTPGKRGPELRVAAAVVGDGTCRAVHLRRGDIALFRNRERGRERERQGEGGKGRPSRTPAMWWFLKWTTSNKHGNTRRGLLRPKQNCRAEHGIPLVSCSAPRRHCPKHAGFVLR